MVQKEFSIQKWYPNKSPQNKQNMNKEHVIKLQAIELLMDRAKPGNKN